MPDMIPGIRVPSRFYAKRLEDQKWTIFAPSVCDFIFKIGLYECRISYVRGSMKHKRLFFLV